MLKSSLREWNARINFWFTKEPNSAVECVTLYCVFYSLLQANHIRTSFTFKLHGSEATNCVVSSFAFLYLYMYVMSVTLQE